MGFMVPGAAGGNVEIAEDENEGRPCREILVARLTSRSPTKKLYKVSLSIQLERTKTEQARAEPGSSNYARQTIPRQCPVEESEGKCPEQEEEP